LGLVAKLREDALAATAEAARGATTGLVMQLGAGPLVIPGVVTPVTLAEVPH
jgi:hypothetical protein